MSEINTDNLILALLTSGKKEYPVTADTKNNKGIVWYTQDSYTGGTCQNQTLTTLFKNASKSQKKNKGKAEFVIDTPEFYIVIEDKDISSDTIFSGYSNIEDYIGKGYDSSRLYKSPIDDVLWYAEHLKFEKDVIAIANRSNGTPENFESVTFYFPKDANFNDLKIVTRGGYAEALLSVSEYKFKIAQLNGEKERTYEEIYDNLRKYAETCSKFMYKVGVDDSDRLGLVSLVALALTNKKSNLYENIKNNNSIIRKEDIEKALLEKNDKSRYGVITNPHHHLPAEKIATLEEYISSIMIKSHLTNNISTTLKEWDDKDKSYEKFFINGGDTILSRVTYSIYNHIILSYDKYKDKGIDVMGTFYSLFLIYYASDKKKGIVLTPNHITRLFCDIAEYFGKQISSETVILDICTGSGGFLIAALNYIDKTIDTDDTLNDKQKAKKKEEIRKKCLIGAEMAPNMFMLAYANMSFHGDGSSRLYNMNSLMSNISETEQTFGSELCELYDPERKFRKELYDNIKENVGKHENEPEKDYENRIKGLVLNEVFKKNGADIGMINPPYGTGYNEYDFINTELKYLKKSGIGLAIVPISNQGIGENEAKQNILEKHTLLASILMPTQLFTNIRNSGASVGTCILVFKAHEPHENFLKKGGKTFLADWREDGFKMVNKHGRFEYKNSWYAPDSGYHDKYITDMEKTLKGDFKKMEILKEAYEYSFPDEDIEEVTMIPSSSFKKDINDGGIKSIAIKIFDNPRTIKVQKRDKNDNLRWKTRKVKGKEEYLLDETGNKIPIEESKKIWDNMDWNILEYVRTDYNELKNEDFIKTMRNYKLFQYMLNNNMLLDDNIGIPEILDIVLSDSFKKWLNDNANMNKSNLSLNNVKWRQFRIADIFRINKVCGRKISDYNTGNYPYVSGTQDNNGITGWVEAPEEDVSIGNCISVDPITTKATYQASNFVGRGFSGASVNLLYNDVLNQAIAHFVITSIQQNSIKYSYARLLNGIKLENLMIWLPIDEDENPNWEWIEEYMKSLPYSDK